MGTRHLIAVIQGGDFKVAQYGQWDGYPNGQGIDVLNFCRRNLADPVTRQHFQQKLALCRFGTDEDIEAAYSAFSTNGMMTMAQSDAFKKSPHAHLSRDTGAGILGMILASQGGLMLQDSREFAGDGLFCEWAWLIDLDRGVFEGYEGLNAAGPVPDDNPFAFANPDPNVPFEPAYKGQSQYFPPLLKGSWPLDSLPDDDAFYAAFADPEDSEEGEIEAA